MEDGSRQISASGGTDLHEARSMMYQTLTYNPHFRLSPRLGQTYRPLSEDFKKLTEGLPQVRHRKALEYLAMTAEQKTWFLLTNPKPHIPAGYGPRGVQVRSGAMYEILVRKWACQKLAEMTRQKDYE